MENKKEELPFSVKVYRRKVFLLDGLFIAITFAGLLLAAFYKLGFGYVIPFLILVFLLWFFLPRIMPSLYVSVYNDKLQIGNKNIFFKDIRLWDKSGRTFLYKFHNDDIQHRFEIYEDRVEYICYKIEQFCKYNNIEYYKK